MSLRTCSRAPEKLQNFFSIIKNNVIFCSSLSLCAIWKYYCIHSDSNTNVLKCIAYRLHVWSTEPSCIPVQNVMEVLQLFGRSQLIVNKFFHLIWDEFVSIFPNLPGEFSILLKFWCHIVGSSFLFNMLWWMLSVDIWRSIIYSKYV